MAARPGLIQSAEARRRRRANVRGLYSYQLRRFRAAYIRAHPHCEDCGEVPSKSELHHKQKALERPDLLTDPDNVMHLCQRCHARRTARGE